VEILSRHREEIKLGRRFILITILLLLCPTLVIDAKQIKKDCLEFTDTDGNEICTEYYEECHDSKGRFINCDEKDKLKNIFKKVVKKCRSEETGKFIKCPSEVR
jgi:hypothetical protein